MYHFITIGTTMVTSNGDFEIILTEQLRLREGGTDRARVGLERKASRGFPLPKKN